MIDWFKGRRGLSAPCFYFKKIYNMKILKRPENIVFDTENPDKMKFSTNEKGLPTPLHYITTKSDFDFLSEYFKAKDGIKHPIFNNFGNSYFYCLEV